MKVDPHQENEIISRWKNGQSMRAISRDLLLGRHVILRVVREHLRQTQPPSQTQSPSPAAAAVKHGPVHFTRKRRLDPFLGELHQLLKRYPKLTVQRALEELRKLGYVGKMHLPTIHPVWPLGQKH